MACFDLITLIVSLICYARVVWDPDCLLWPAVFLNFSKISFLESMLNYGKYAGFILFFFQSVKMNFFVFRLLMRCGHTECLLGGDVWKAGEVVIRQMTMATGLQASGRKASWQIRSASEISLIRIPGWKYLSLSLPCKLVFQFIRSSNKCVLGLSLRQMLPWALWIQLCI